MNNELSNLTYGIVGLGIMGGSIAKAIRTNIGATIYALDVNQDSLSSGKKQGIIDKAFTPEQTEEMLKCCDFLFVCLYPHATLEFLRNHKNHYKNNSIITDISGVKTLLENEIDYINPHNAHLILGHPMAGGAKEGYDYSNGEYFANRNYIIINHKNCSHDKYALELFKDFISTIGFTKITETDADTHDNKIGFTSQLCHVVASAMVESAPDPEITSFGGGSSEDLTRIAMINAPLWTELFLSNKEKLLKHIETFKEQINIIENLIKDDDSEGLKTLLKDVRYKRIQMN